MVVDTSVILHIFFEEAGWERSVAYLSRQESLLLSAASLVEAQAVIAGRTTGAAYDLLDRLVRDLGIEVVSVTVRQANMARQAYLKYGKGQGHRAQLNFGDVISYALAKDRQQELGCVGDDFIQTDLETVRLPP